jgi:uncharacterized protein
MRTHTLHVVGMHCQSCVVLTEQALSEVASISSAVARLRSNTVEVSGDLPETAADAAALLSPHMPEGYSLVSEAPQKNISWKEFGYAVPIAALLIFGFLMLQKTGVAQFNGSSTGLGAALLIGLVASVSTCLAVVGGLVLSVSANYAKAGEKFKPQLMFHAGRLAGFFVLGGILGTIGRSLRLGITGNLVLTVAVGIVMLLLGINLLDIFRSTMHLRLPKQFSAKIHALRTSTHAATPLLLGAATFFLPCGFTQSMQAYALTTGNFSSGALIMLVFALGTLPMLALLSFSAFSINNKPWRGTFFKTAGLLVIALAVVNIASGLAVAGIIEPLFNL